MIERILGTYGVLGRGACFGPGFATVDLGVMKNFAIRERFNKGQFQQPDYSAEHE